MTHSILKASLLVLFCFFGSACSNTAKQAETLQLVSEEYASTCNAAIDTAQTQYIIGYGSLMQEESRQRTAPNAGSALAVEIQGFRRGWFAKGSDTGFSTTFLGAMPDDANSFNAVVFAVSPADLAAIDKREAGYCRSAVLHSHIHTAKEDVDLPQGQYWIYLNSAQSIALPGKHKPLVQSYVDIFISGCLEQEEQQQLPGFAEHCINSTTDWSAFWVNDRIYPRRPFIYQPRAGQIDRLLNSALPGLFKQIVVE